MNKFFLVKRKPTDIPLFRAYVVSVGCIVDNDECNGGIQPNHFNLAAQGGSDLSCAGCCDFHHKEFHRIAFAAFVAKYNIDWEKCRTRLLEGFFRSIEIGFTPAFTPDKKKRARGKALAPLTKTCSTPGSNINILA